MYISPTGHFFGHTTRKLALDGLTVTDTEYSYEFINWHFHEHSHFELTLRGTTNVGGRKGKIPYGADTLLFHNRQEPHYNVKSAGLTRGFQLEISDEWLRRFDLDESRLPDSSFISHPGVKLLFYTLFKETKLADDASPLAVAALTVDIFTALNRGIVRPERGRPGWVAKIEGRLRDDLTAPPTLQELSKELNLHWAHLSREFPRHFNCTFGAYVRRIRVEKSLSLLHDSNLSLTEIAAAGGFSDQSHFIRCFREFFGLAPKEFRKLLR
jgi:AraC family transcriptional regulator